MDGADPNLLTSSYYYADAQVVCQRQHDPAEPETYDSSWYVHDRLGSVRLVVVPVEEPGGLVVRAFNSYTYTPFGQFQEGQCVEHIANPWKFTGQWHDVEIDQYHLRARQYDPTMMRFTSRDPVRGSRQEPLTLHRYLYCWNNPVSLVDLNGRNPMVILGAFVGGVAGLIEGVSAWMTFEFDLMASGVELTPEQRHRFMVGFLVGHTVKGVAVGAVTTLTGGIGTAMTMNLATKVTTLLCSGVVTAELYKHYSKGGDATAKAAGVSLVSNTRQVAMLSFIDQNF